MTANPRGPGGNIDVSDRPGRELGRVTVIAAPDDPETPGVATEATLAALLAALAAQGVGPLASEATLAAARDVLLGVSAVEGDPMPGDLLAVAGVELGTGLLRALRTDSVGRLKQSHGQPPPVAGPLAAIGNALALPMDGFSTATFYFSGVHNGANVTFEQSPDSTDGVNGTWFATIAAQASANTAVSATGVITANSAIAYDIAAPGASFVRARLTAITSGALTAMATASTSTTEPAPAVGTHSVTLSNTTLAVPSTSTSTTPAPAASHVKSAATTNATLAKATVTKLVGVVLFNRGAAERVLKVYNKATLPTVGTDTPLFRFPLKPGEWTIYLPTYPPALSTGFGYALTAGIADTDTAAIGADEVIGHLLYT